MKGFFTPRIISVSDLKNSGEALSHCGDGAPVYVTKNGRFEYVVQSMADYEKQLATIRLLTELSRGVESLRTEGGLTIDEAFEGVCSHGKRDHFIGGAKGFDRRPRHHRR